MKKVFIKYNPYQVTTEILVDDNPLKKNSRLNVGDRRLQEWVDDLPDILFEECNERNFEITFHGTIPDYEDVLAIAEDAKKKNINIRVEHIPAKEVKDKESAIQEIFDTIQNGPFEELKKPDVVKAFELAKSSDYEVNVVATMSAGKSTLINSLLGQKLMPAKQEACTATITEIKDNDADHFTAKVYDKNGNLIESTERLTYSVMQRLNGNPDVQKIRAEGNIPFVTADDVALVLVDTPGPNNSRDPEHKAATYRMLSESSKAVVLYIMNATQLAVDDDSNLLKHVAESMQVGGKQSRDRFIFVVNKLDDFKKEEDSVDAALQKVKDYLADNGIENPNIYPASALTALNIRTILSENDDDDDDEVYEAKGKVRKFNRNEEMHFEKYAPLPTSVKEQVANRLAKAIEDGDANEQALIHSGVVPIEEAIRMYVRKYAKTAKIKNIVDTFITRIESANSFENTLQQISKDEADKKAIVDKIDSIEAKLKSGEEAKKFKTQIEKINYNKEISDVADNVIKKAQERISRQLSDSSSRLTRYEAEEACKNFANFADDLQAEVLVRLENLIQNNIQKNAKDLLDTYKNKLAELVEEVDIGDVKIDPFKMILGEIPTNTSGMISSSSRTEYVKTGERWVENTNKKWYKPWTWFQEKGHYEDIMENQEYVDGEELAGRFFAPIQESLYDNRAAAVEYAKEQAQLIKNNFAAKFDELDKVLKDKLDDLKQCATDERIAEKKLAESKKRLEWLENVQARVKSILEI
ncbi:MAG: dynamin family protein [Oscillospiraceae bacterium]|nr:dynamin family protein [Oscillospiraceae bacterium]